ncbi:hypothetical protein [Mycolicibacterium llatzerense]|uniref:hypothetical protein n=1 Tax=Mycolicibacterium llatzerense TaxID=280871 RepID=UPI0013A6E5DB|nr:hypothetical protein [Mycolicibacterium llatzerense]
MLFGLPSAGDAYRELELDVEVRILDVGVLLARSGYPQVQVERRRGRRLQRKWLGPLPTVRE